MVSKCLLFGENFRYEIVGGCICGLLFGFGNNFLFALSMYVLNCANVFWL